ncbi:MAG: hypothetical protein ABII06_15080 [Pseudomonadota bacterium]
MSEKEISLGRIFVQEAVKAGTWGLIFLLVMGMLLTSIKQEIKEGISYGVDRIVSMAIATATDPYLVGKAKQLGKEGIEYTLTKAAGEVKGIMEQDISRSGRDRR